MKFYLAPMEGITGYIYRQAYNSCFKPMDRYFTPFLAPKHKSGFSSKELNDILPEHNQGMDVVPQILTSNSEDFLDTAVKLKEYGYKEVNLNLGCPSGTVAAKGKGAGFLKDTEKLARFLGEISEGMERENLRFSIKTRVGVESEEEFGPLLELYNQCPLTELIIHPRVLKDFYKYNVRMDAFKEGYEKSRHSVCYNGDVFRKKDHDRLVKEYPDLDKVMMGRGIMMDPFLTEEITGEMSGKADEKIFEETSEKMSGAEKAERLEQFHRLLCDGYARVMSGDRPVLFKMKELWGFLILSCPEEEKFMKKIRKAQRLTEYEAVVSELFRHMRSV